MTSYDNLNFNEELFKEFLERNVGDQVDEEVLKNTPLRVARMYEGELLAGYKEDPKALLSKTFKTDTVGPVLIRKIRFYSLCEHHMLPFFGTIDISYIPKNGIVAGLSKFSRLVKVYSRRLQLQERLTKEINDTINDCLEPKAVVTRCQAQHLCMQMRGSHAEGSDTETWAFKGDSKEGILLLKELLST